MAKLNLSSPAEFADYVGKELGTSEMFEVTQDQINLFADATEDHQWIHVDPERATKESPFGGPIAHGYFSLSIIPHLLFQILSVEGTKLIVNYGINKVRFPAPVPIGSKIFAKASIASIKDIGKGSVEVEFSVVVSVDGASKPSCVASILYRYYV
jgi:acyl dehydratase